MIFPYRIESNAYEDLRSRSNSHLTGEMIRQMNALQKKHGGNASAAAAATALAYQHQLQMQATYERVLRVSKQFVLELSQ